MYIKLNDREKWIEIAEQVNKAEREIFELIEMTSGKIPETTLKYLYQSNKNLNIFKGLAEERMIRNGIDDIKLFYGR